MPPVQSDERWRRIGGLPGCNCSAGLVRQSASRWRFENATTCIMEVQTPPLSRGLGPLPPRQAAVAMSRNHHAAGHSGLTQMYISHTSQAWRGRNRQWCHVKSSRFTVAYTRVCASVPLPTLHMCPTAVFISIPKSSIRVVLQINVHIVPSGEASCSTVDHDPSGATIGGS